MKTHGEVPVENVGILYNARTLNCFTIEGNVSLDEQRRKRIQSQSTIVVSAVCLPTIDHIANSQTTYMYVIYTIYICIYIESNIRSSSNLATSGSIRKHLALKCSRNNDIVFATCNVNLILCPSCTNKIDLFL